MTSPILETSFLFVILIVILIKNHMSEDRLRWGGWL